ncbi:MAG: hypothetical protein QXO16_08520 [Archaeoglobaceae archaeon]
MFRKLLFPPFATLVAIVTLTIITNLVTTNDTTSTELFTIDLETSLGSENVTKPSRISVSIVATGATVSYCGIYVYDPDGNLYAFKEASMQNNFAIIDLWFGRAVKSGNYTIVPFAGYDRTRYVLGKPIVLSVR